jgi:hypothetical protein
VDPLNLVKGANSMIRSTIFEDNQACYQRATTDPGMTHDLKALV